MAAHPTTCTQDHLRVWPSVLLSIYFLFSGMQRLVGGRVLVYIHHRGIENGVLGHFLRHIITYHVLTGNIIAHGPEEASGEKGYELHFLGT